MSDKARLYELIEKQGGWEDKYDFAWLVDDFLFRYSIANVDIDDDTPQITRQEYYHNSEHPKVEKAERHNSDKPQLSMVLEVNHALNGCAEVLAFGADKYIRGNWQKGLSHTQIADSLLRHLTAYLSGEDKDKESNCLHVDHVLTNALFLAQMVRTHKELDDRTTGQSS